MARLPQPPPTGNRSAALLFLGIMCATGNAGRGVASLINCLRGGCAAWLSPHGAPQPPYALPPDHAVCELLSCVRVLLRHAECGEEVLAVHDAMEGELAWLGGQVAPAGGWPSWGSPSQAGVCGVPLLCGLQPTAEQANILRTALECGPDGRPRSVVTRLQAFAGTAKSTTAAMLVAAHRQYNFLYLVYNKDAQVSMEKAMREHRTQDGGRYNFEVATTHALAMRNYGRRVFEYPPRVPNRPDLSNFRELSSRDVRSFLVSLWQPRSDRHVRVMAVGGVRRTLARYMASGDEELSERHLPEERKVLEAMDDAICDMLWRRDGAARVRRDLATGRVPRHPAYSRGMVVEAARALWGAVLDPGSRLPVPHNAYLKAYALSRPRLDPWEDGRPLVILVDEAQDLNGVTKHLLLDCQPGPVILFGDRYQQIYSFNYACGLMSGRVEVPRAAPRDLPLRQTFRFGPEIAAAVNAVLKAAFAEPHYIVGKPPSLGHPGLVYCVVPEGRDLDTVTHADLFPPEEEDTRGRGGGPGSRAPRRGAAAGAACSPSPAGPSVFVAVMGSQGNPFTMRSVPAVLSSAGMVVAAGRGDAAAAGEAAAAGPDRVRVRLVQCPLRGSAASADWPPELEVTPKCGVAILPSGLLPPGCPAAASRPSYGTSTQHGHGHGHAPALPRVTYVARTNVALVAAALELVSAGHRVCASFKARGGAWQRMLGRTRDVARFIAGHRAFGPAHELYGLEDERELEDLVEMESDSELHLAYTLAKEHSLDDVEAMGSKLVDERTAADYYLVTAHKMKGDQAPVVQLADDWRVQLAPATPEGHARLARCRADSAAADELHAVYVTASRARAVLLAGRDLSALLLGLHRRHVQLVLPGSRLTSEVADEKAAALATPAQPSTPVPSVCASPGSTLLEGIRACQLLSPVPAPSPATHEPHPACPQEAACGAASASQAPSHASAPVGCPSAAIGTPSKHPQRSSQDAPGTQCSGASSGARCGLKRLRDGGAEPVAGAGSHGNHFSLASGAAPPSPKTPRAGTPEARVTRVAWAQPAGQQRNGAGPAASQACSMCSLAIHTGHQEPAALPRVTWRSRPVCGPCAAGTLFGQALQLAAAATAGEAAGPAASQAHGREVAGPQQAAEEHERAPRPLAVGLERMFDDVATQSKGEAEEGEPGAKADGELGPTG